MSLQKDFASKEKRAARPVLNLKLRTEPPDQFVFGLIACDTVLDLAALEEHQGGNAHHTVLDHDVRVLVGIQFYHFDLALPLLCQLLDDGVEHLAGLAPGGGEIHQHGLAGIQDFALEVGLGHVLHFTHVGLHLDSGFGLVYGFFKGNLYHHMDVPTRGNITLTFICGHDRMQSALATGA